MGVDQEPNQIVRAQHRDELLRRPTLSERAGDLAHLALTGALEYLVIQPVTRTAAVAGTALHHLRRAA